MYGALITFVFVLAAIYLAYRRLSLLTYSLTFTLLLAAYMVLGSPSGPLSVVSDTAKQTVATVSKGSVFAR